MPIDGSLVAYRQVIVAEEGISPSARLALHKMLRLLPCNDGRVSYQVEQGMYHFLVENEIVYVCITSGPYENRIVFGFLIQIKDAFKTDFVTRAGNSSFHADLTPKNCQAFSPTLASSRNVFNSNPHADRIGQIKDQLNTTREVILQNLDSIIDRGDHIDTLCDRTDLLRDEAQGFHSNTHSLKRAVLFRNIKIIVGVVISLAILVIITAFSICGIYLKKCW
ncbi:hypothetical protein JKF63_04953 [Porcisia hertigi]|uniref:Vesicle-associated membrane protein 7 n=1 Tax=Porcisia hertigi TaxID=2761500 RepID=A0A836L9Y1_9TRYP|nr:hypothetical protein JKF63_04953 [Porcisia hertigi]